MGKPNNGKIIGNNKDKWAKQDNLKSFKVTNVCGI
jgi:hypothetical protein